MPMPMVGSVLPDNPFAVYPVDPRPGSRIESMISRTSLEPEPTEDVKLSTITGAQPLPVAATSTAIAPPMGVYNLPPPGYYGIPPGYPPPVTSYPSVQYPGVYPTQTRQDAEYELAVQKFLDQTTGKKSGRDEWPRDARSRHTDPRHRDHEGQRRPSESDRRSRERDRARRESKDRESTDHRKRESNRRSKDPEPSEKRKRGSELPLKKDLSKMTVDEIAETFSKQSRSSSKEAREEKAKDSKKKDRESDRQRKEEKEKMRKEREEEEKRQEQERKKLEEKEKRGERLGFSPNAKKVFKMGLDESSSEDEEESRAKPKTGRVF